MIEYKEYKGLKYIEITDPKWIENNLHSCNHKKVCIFMYKDTELSSHDKDVIEKHKSPNKWQTTFKRSDAFHMVLKNDFPDCEILYYNSYCMHSNLKKLNQYISENVKIPESISIEITTARTNSPARITATTIKNGKIQKVSKPIDKSIHLFEAVEKHIPYFVKNCPKPQEDISLKCSKTLADIMKTATHSAVRDLAEWKKKAESRYKAGFYLGELNISGRLLLNSHIENLTVKRKKTNLILANITLKDGHEIIEDDKGCDINIKQVQLPEAVKASLKGRILSDIIEADWAKNIVIKTVREDNEKRKKNNITLSLRGSCEIQDFNVPEGQELSDENAEELILSLINQPGSPNNWETWKSVDAALIPVLNSLTAQELCNFLANLRKEQTISLEKYGHPDWTAKFSGNHIVLDKSPSVDMANFYRDYKLRK